MQRESGHFQAPPRGAVVPLSRDAEWSATVLVPSVCAATLVGHMDEVWGVRFSPDCSRLASFSRDGAVIVSGQEGWVLPILSRRCDRGW